MLTRRNSSFDRKFSIEKLHLNYLVMHFLQEKYIQSYHKQNKVKTKSIKPEPGS